MRFTITQAIALTFCQQLKILFNGGSISQNQKSYCQFSLQDARSLKRLAGYLNMYPLKSDKVISFKRWSRLFEYKEKEKDINYLATEKSIKKLKRLVSSINKFN